MAEQPPPSLQHTLLDVHRRSWPPNLPFPVAELQPQPEPEPEPEQLQADPARPLSPLTQELRLLDELRKIEADELGPLRSTLVDMQQSLQLLQEQVGDDSPGAAEAAADAPAAGGEAEVAWTDG